MSDYIYTIILSLSSLIALLYIFLYYSTFASNCNKFGTETITEQACCQGTWEDFGSSISMTLVIILICVFFIYGVFYWNLS